ncbi:GxxExxY protein [Flavobacterium sp. RHBU_3]|uniref:GxxExxY protein n=1 Tax=Flavobacterium sp. RHBU_3 TaxID=3391184 RepID=UPI003984C47F
MTENQIAKIAFDCALKVHKALGPGLLESAYTECLCYEIYKSGLYVEKEKPMPLQYGEIKLDTGYRTDIIVENKFIIEVKSVEEVHDIHLAQLLTYLKLSGCKLGFLINFNVILLKDGLRRVINGTL